MTQFSPHPANPKHCQGCHYFGGWLPIKVGEQISYTTHTECLNPKLSRVVALPEAGCAHWVALAVDQARSGS